MVCVNEPLKTIRQCQYCVNDGYDFLFRCSAVTEAVHITKGDDRGRAVVIEIYVQ